MSAERNVETVRAKRGAGEGLCKMRDMLNYMYLGVSARLSGLEGYFSGLYRLLERWKQREVAGDKAYTAPSWSRWRLTGNSKHGRGDRQSWQRLTEDISKFRR